MYKSVLKINHPKLVAPSLTLVGRLVGQSWKTQSCNHFVGVLPQPLGPITLYDMWSDCSLFQILKQWVFNTMPKWIGIWPLLQRGVTRRHCRVWISYFHQILGRLCLSIFSLPSFSDLILKITLRMTFSFKDFSWPYHIIWHVKLLRAYPNYWNDGYSIPGQNEYEPDLYCKAV